MERLLFECAVRALLIAASTALVLWGMRIKSAAARHRAWTGVVLLMLLLPIWTTFGPDVPLRVLQPEPVAAEISSTPASISTLQLPTRIQGSVEMPARSPLETRTVVPEPTRVIDWQSLLLGIYLTGALILLLRLALGTVQAHRLIRSAILQDGRLTSGSCTSPITVGWFNPVVILPVEWQQWPAAQLEAILTHETEHARRHHPFVQWLALLNRAIFWFHPLTWWLERRVSALAEEACDAAVLSAGHLPQDYSEYLLNLARSMMRDGKRVQVVGMAMPGSCLNQRIRQILVGIPSQRISRPRIGCTVAFCTISSVVFAAGTLSPREAQPLNPKATVVPVASPAPQDSTPIAAQEETTPLSSSPSSLVVAVTDTFVPVELAAVSSEQSAIPPAPALPPGPRDLREEETVSLMPPVPLPQQDRGAPVVPPALFPSPMGLVSGLTFAVREVKQTQAAGAWWTDPLLLVRLGLTNDQRAKIEKAFEDHRQNILSSKERLRNEEAQHARLLEAEPVDGQAVLTQIDRVVQARGEMERANAAMNLEVRGYLTPAQRMQLRTQVPITSIDSLTFQRPQTGFGGGQVRQ